MEHTFGVPDSAADCFLDLAEEYGHTPVTAPVFRLEPVPLAEVEAAMARSRARGAGPRTKPMSERYIYFLQYGTRKGEFRTLTHPEKKTENQVLADYEQARQKVLAEDAGRGEWTYPDIFDVRSREMGYSEAEAEDIWIGD